MRRRLDALTQSRFIGRPKSLQLKRSFSWPIERPNEAADCPGSVRDLGADDFPDASSSSVT